MMYTRRQFLQRSVATTVPLFVVGVPAQTSPPRRRHLPKVKPDVVIYEGTYPGWPWITAGHDGTLYCVFREGTVHGYSANGRVMLAKS